MRRDKDIQDWLRIFKNLTDPDIKAINRRKELRKKRMEAKKLDVGL